MKYMTDLKINYSLGTRARYQLRFFDDHLSERYSGSAGHPHHVNVCHNGFAEVFKVLQQLP